MIDNQVQAIAHCHSDSCELSRYMQERDNRLTDRRCENSSKGLNALHY